LSDPYVQIYVQGYVHKDGSKCTRLEYLDLWTKKQKRLPNLQRELDEKLRPKRLRALKQLKPKVLKELDQPDTEQHGVSADKRDTGQCLQRSAKHLTKKNTKKTRRINVNQQDKNAEDQTETGSGLSTGKTQRGVELAEASKSISERETDTKLIDQKAGSRSGQGGLDVIPPTDLKLPCEILRQDVSQSMSLIDSTATDLLSLMRKVIQPINDTEEEGVAYKNLDRAKVAGGIAREIKELIKVKVDAARVLKDMVL